MATHNDDNSMSADPNTAPLEKRGVARSGKAENATGGGGKPPKKPPAVSTASMPRRRGGYMTPPVDTQFQPGESGNPSGRRKAPKLPTHVGNQIDGVTAAIIGELNHIMMHGVPKKPPTGPYSGAKLFARMLYRDAITKDGYARRSLYALYYEQQKHLEIFRRMDRSELEAQAMAKMVRAIVNPSLTDADLEQLLEQIAKDNRELGEPN